MSTGSNLVLAGGALTFGNEWIQTGTPNWRMPIGTLGIALLTAGISRISDGAGTAFGVIVLVAALTVRFNGKSVAEEALSVFPGPHNTPSKKVKIK